MEEVTAKIPTSEVPITFTSPNATSNPVQIPKKKRLLILLSILLLVLIASISTFFYFEARNRSELITQFEANRYHEVLESPYTPYQFVSPSPAIYASPIMVSPGKHFIAENDRYSVYLHVKGGTQELEGSLSISDKNTNEVIAIEDNFVIFGTPSIYQSPDMKFLVLGTGSYIFRGADIISLEKKKKVASFCNWSGEVYFWNDYAVYTGCDTNPTNDNEMETNVEAVSLTAREKKVLMGVNETGVHNFFKIVSLDEAHLIIEETYVHSPADWTAGDQSKIFTRTHSVDLSQRLN